MEKVTNSKYGFNVWTKNAPKSYIDLFAKYASERNTPIGALVDDVLPGAVFNRTPQQTAEMNAQYYDYMINAGFNDVIFVSELFEDRNYDLQRIYTASRKITLSEFISLLPEYKRLKQPDTGLNEMIDPCWQLEVLSAGISVRGISTYLTGKRSLALFRSAKDHIANFNFEVIDE